VVEYIGFLTSKKQGKKKKLTYKDLPGLTVRVICEGLLEERAECGEYYLGTAEELEQLKAKVSVNPDGSKTYIIPMLRPASAKYTDEELIAQFGKPSNEVGISYAWARLIEKAKEGTFEVME
jgi:hypothetical protein